MDVNKRKHNGIEINDLIGDAVNNAVARRNQILDSEDGLLDLSDGEAASVGGGRTEAFAKATIQPVDFEPAIAGMIIVCPPIKPICPPYIVGLIAVDENVTLA